MAGLLTPKIAGKKNTILSFFLVIEILVGHPRPNEISHPV